MLYDFFLNCWIGKLTFMIRLHFFVYNNTCMLFSWAINLISSNKWSFTGLKFVEKDAWRPCVGRCYKRAILEAQKQTSNVRQYWPKFNFGFISVDQKSTGNSVEVSVRFRCKWKYSSASISIRYSRPVWKVSECSLCRF